MNTMDKMIKARAALILDQRFYGSLACKLLLTEDPTCETAWTDGVSIGFNPVAVMAWSMDECKFVWMHEAGGHCVLGHHVRRNERDPGDWNVATDYATNGMIKKSGMFVPAWALFDPRFDGKSSEEIYPIIRSEKSKNQDSKNDPGKAGEVRDYPGFDGNKPSESELQQQEQNWQIAAASAAQTAEGCGQMPGGLKQVVKQMLAPKVPWKEVLQRFVDQVSHNDYTYQRTNPRYAAFGIILPSLYDKELPPIDIWVDTSGSISNKDKEQFVGEINDIRSHYRTTIRIVYCDTKVRHTEIIEPDMLFEAMTTHGGGGTKFMPSIDWSSNQEDQPCCGIYLTDMENGSEKLVEPEYPVLWIDTRSSSYATVPSFGEVVSLHPVKY